MVPVLDKWQWVNVGPEGSGRSKSVNNLSESDVAR